MNAELADMPFMYEVAQGKRLAVERMYMERFPARSSNNRAFLSGVKYECLFYVSRNDTGIIKY